MVHATEQGGSKRKTCGVLTSLGMIVAGDWRQSASFKQRSRNSIIIVGHIPDVVAPPLKLLSVLQRPDPGLCEPSSSNKLSMLIFRVE